MMRFIRVYLSDDYRHVLSLFASHYRAKRRARELWEVHHSGWLT